MNSHAESKHPCLTPDYNLNYGDVTPLFIIQRSTSVYIIFIHLLKYSPKSAYQCSVYPLCFSVLSRNIFGVESLPVFLKLTI